MAEPARKPATYEDLLRVPDNLVAEILGGELVTAPRPAIPHAWTSSELGISIGGPFNRGIGGPGGWWILDEPELHLGSDVLVPDLAGWRKERLPRRPASAALSLPPDWVCEVLSERTQRVDRLRKMPIYAREGVGHLWLIDPLACMLEVYRLERGRWTLLGTHADDETVRAEPFHAVPLELAPLWGGVGEE